MRRSILSGVLTRTSLVLICSAGAQAQEPTQVPAPVTTQELERLKSDLDDLRAHVAELEARPGMQLGALPTAEVGDVEDRRNMTDRQTPAPRLENLALDPELRGFVPVLGSSMLVKFNAKPRVDAFWDDTDPGNRDRFVPAQFPVSGDPNYGGGSQVNVTTNATQFSIEARDPQNPNGFRFYYQNDFYGSTNENMRYRLQHVYGQTHNLVAGFTYGVFEDPDIWPDTVDYEGPNSLIFARRPLLHYKARLGKEMNATFGVEQPDVYIDTTAAPTASESTRAPDVGFNVRWERRGTGHAQGSAIFRSLGVHGSGVDDQSVFGWGTNFSLGLDVTEQDSFGILLVGGEGIGGLGNDTSFLNSDAAIDANGDLEALPYYSAMLSFRHEWTEVLRSTVTYGYVSLDSVSGQTADAYETSQYASANLIYAFRRQATMGLELLYGDKSVRDGRDSEVFRLQFGLTYWLF